MQQNNSNSSAVVNSTKNIPNAEVEVKHTKKLWTHEVLVTSFHALKAYYKHAGDLKKDIHGKAGQKRLMKACVGAAKVASSILGVNIPSQSLFWRVKYAFVTFSATSPGSSWTVFSTISAARYSGFARYSDLPKIIRLGWSEKRCNKANIEIRGRLHESKPQTSKVRYVVNGVPTETLDQSKKG